MFYKNICFWVLLINIAKKSKTSNYVQANELFLLNFANEFLNISKCSLIPIFKHDRSIVFDIFGLLMYFLKKYVCLNIFYNWGKSKGYKTFYTQ